MKPIKKSGGYSVSELRHDRHAHIQRLPGGHAAALRKRIQADVDPLVGRQMALPGGRSLEADPVRTDFMTGKSFKQPLSHGGIVEQSSLISSRDVTADRRIRAQTRWRHRISC